MKSVKWLSLVLALLVTVGIFTACSKFKYDNSTVVAMVEFINGQKVVLLVGETDFGEGMRPENLGNGMGNIPDFGGEMPDIEDLPEGEFPSGFGGMQMPQGAPSEDFDGMQIPNGQFSSGFRDMQMPFKENGDKITLTLNSETVKTLSVGSIVQITFGDNGSVEALTSIDDMMIGFVGEGVENFIPLEQNSAADDFGS